MNFIKIYTTYIIAHKHHTQCTHKREHAHTHQCRNTHISMFPMPHLGRTHRALVPGHRGRKDTWQLRRQTGGGTPCSAFMDKLEALVQALNGLRRPHLTKTSMCRSMSQKARLPRLGPLP
uniref:Uncharacterized protein n=1 Tax=Triticum urartu TaxID=4572 RepID=A0A8R7UQE5_TRIUA